MARSPSLMHADRNTFFEPPPLFSKVRRGEIVSRSNAFHQSRVTQKHPRQKPRSAASALPRCLQVPQWGCSKEKKEERLTKCFISVPIRCSSGSPVEHASSLHAKKRKPGYWKEEEILVTLHLIHWELLSQPAACTSPSIRTSHARSGDLLPSRMWKHVHRSRAVGGESWAFFSSCERLEEAAAAAAEEERRVRCWSPVSYCSFTLDRSENTEREPLRDLWCSTWWSITSIFSVHQRFYYCEKDG